MREVINFPYQGASRTADCEIPDYCPMCHRAITPATLEKHCYKHRSGYLYLAQLFLCKGCYDTFILECKLQEAPKEANLRGAISSVSYIGETVFCAPQKPKKEEFDVYISEDVSPSFVEIFNQALAAEAYSLNEIAGCGYRKAVEFLIKDYLILKNAGDPEKIEKIKTSFLGPCIQTYVTDENIKTVASRAAWLGNDHIHFVRKHDDKDIDFLKRLIRVTSNWICNEHETEEAAKMEFK